tara:strand:+ start:1322 stop:2869 length:1548 start_codon:yes stop_codon:yes gene_type:complete
MANITIIKLKVRRGSNAQRESIVLDQGEVGYTLDTKRLFVGDGATYGGNPIGNKNIGPYNAATSLGPDSSPGLQIGDIGYANSLLYILTAANYNDALSGYGYIGPVSDDTLIEFNSDNKLTVKKGGFDAQYLTSDFFGDGLLSSAGGIASVNLNSTYFEISNLKITPVAESITEREISTTALSGGLVGGNGTKLKLSIDPDQFEFDEQQRLKLKSIGDITINADSWAGQSGINLVGSGLSLNGVTGLLEADLRSVDSSTFSLGTGETAGRISLAGTNNVGQEFPYLELTNGLTTTLQSSIFDIITATSLSGEAVDECPVGTILPHARAFTVIPAGYLLCDGSAYDSTNAEYRGLFDVIGSNWNTAGDMSDPGGDLFRVPKLDGGDVLLYGNDASAPGSNVLYLSGATTPLGNKDFPKLPSVTTGSLSAVGVNFIIKYKKASAMHSIFNGAPNQATIGYARNIYDQQIYEGLDSSGANIQLSSAGFIAFNNSGTVRNSTNTENNTFDRFAIPVFNW